MNHRAVTLLVALALPSSAMAQQGVPVPDAIRRLSGGQFEAELVTHGIMIPDSFRTLVDTSKKAHLPILQVGVAGLTVYQAVQPESPGHLFGWDGRTAYCLGGCRSVEIRQLADAIGLRATPRSADRLAQELAVLADPNGASLVLFPGGWKDSAAVSFPFDFLISSVPEQIHRLLATLSEARMADTLAMRPDGTMLVRLNVLSFHPGFAGYWEHFVYGFAFGADGHLDGWEMYAYPQELH